MTYWTKILSLALGLLLLTPASAQTKGKEEKKKDNKFSYVQAVDIFGSSLALLDRHFVDSIDIKRLSRIGLDGMLESLDPYTRVLFVGGYRQAPSPDDWGLWRYRVGHLAAPR